MDMRRDLPILPPLQVQSVHMEYRRELLVSVADCARVLGEILPWPFEGQSCRLLTSSDYITPEVFLWML